MSKAKYVFFNTIILIALALLGTLFIEGADESGYKFYNYLFCLFGTLVFLWCLWSWYKLRKEILCPYVIFLSTAYVFMFGQSMLLALGIPINPMRDLHSRYSNFIMLKANVFTCLGLCAFHNGALFSAKVEKCSNKCLQTSNERYKNKIKYLYKSMQVVGWLLFLISIGPTVANTVNSIRLVSSYGYRFLYDESLIRIGVQNWSKILQQFFVPSLICLFICSHNNKFIRWFVIFFSILYILSGLYLGGRGKPVVLILCLICMWHFLIKPIKGCKSLLFVISGIIFISFLSVIFKLRNVPNRTFLDYVELFLNSFGKENLFVEAISEMGGSMFPLINVMLLVPDVFSFRYGESYLYALFSLIPNLGFWDLHPSTIKANLGDWLQDVLGIGYGPGFSMAAEAYINFGWFGIIFMTLLGCFYGWLFSLISRKEKPEQYNPVIFFFVFSILSMTMMTVRNSFIGTVRAFIYYTIPVCVLCLMIAEYLGRYEIKKHNS